MNHLDPDGAYPSQEPNMPYNRPTLVAVRYKECLKNHAASMGGNAVDGCGEFMPGVDAGCGGNDPYEALKCAVCGCHRNFHRKEVAGESSRHQSPRYDTNAMGFIGRRRTMMGQFGSESLQVASPNMGGGSTPSESTDHGDGDGDGFVVRPVQRTKRHRTKFSQEQKEKLLSFAEKAGWKMQKLDESVVQQFCQEIGIKRKVLKVWMHNNKQHYVNKDPHFNKDHLHF